MSIFRTSTNITKMLQNMIQYGMFKVHRHTKPLDKAG